MSLYAAEQSAKFKSAINDFISEKSFGSSPSSLYDPISYILEIGGKRLRPQAVLFSYCLYKEDWQEIVEQALSLEVFHNFTLMHDDIMDNAPLRRGKATVHEKWNTPTAILSGDVMLVKAYEMLMANPNENAITAFKRFNDTATEVCEGQQWDMVYEQRDTVSKAEYINMIRLKTAVLLGLSFEMGGIFANASDSDCKNLYLFGEQAGIGFQIMDDWLDLYAEKGKSGKQAGGDILASKKTILLVKLLEEVPESKHQSIIDLYHSNEENKLSTMVEILNEYSIKEKVKVEMDTQFNKALSYLEKLDVNKEKKSLLEEFAKGLINRVK